jgi:hypothetical protein
MRRRTARAGRAAERRRQDRVRTSALSTISVVMPGLDPGIHVFLHASRCQDVDGRVSATLRPAMTKKIIRRASIGGRRLSRSNCQTAKLHQSRCGIPREPRPDFRGRSVTSGFFFMLPRNRGSGAPYGAGVETVPIKHGDQPRRIFRGRPRLTALHCGVFSALASTLGPRFPLVPVSTLAGAGRV